MKSALSTGMYSRRAFEVLKGVMECEPFVIHDVKYIKRRFGKDVFNTWFNNVEILDEHHIAIDNLTNEIIVMPNRLFDDCSENVSSRQMLKCIGTLIQHVARCHNKDGYIVLSQIEHVHGHIMSYTNVPPAKFSAEDAKIVASVLKGEDVMKMYDKDTLNEVVGKQNDPIKHESIKCLTNEIQILVRERDVALSNAESWENQIDIDLKFNPLIADAHESLVKLRGEWINDNYLIDLERNMMPLSG